MTNVTASRHDQVAAAVTGERVAVQQLLATARPFVMRYCRARIGRRDGSADRLAAEVCRAVLGALAGYREQDGPFLSFVHRIAAVMVEAHLSTGLTTGPTIDTAAPVADPIDGLPPEQREILVLRAVVGLSAAETAALLGCTDAKVRLLQHRALNTLRAGLGAGLQPGLPQRRQPDGKRTQTGLRHDRVLGDKERGRDGA